ncbi:MAG: head GIN domain-containing protein [Bacteroidota bacterium]
MIKLKLPFLLFFLITSYLGVAQSRETRDVARFSEISLRSGGTVYLTQGNTQKVELKGDRDILEKIETEVRGGRLSIGYKNSKRWGWSNNGRFDVYITVKEIEGISVSGAGNIRGENEFKTDDLDLSVSGSGRMELEVDARTVEMSVSGSGKIMIEGTTREAYTSMSGSGRIKAEDLKSETYKVRISGSGSCEIYATDEIDARISGSGSVYYRGNPPRVNNSTSGSGRIRKM